MHSAWFPISIIVFIQVPIDCVFVIIFFKTMDNKKIIRFAFCDILNNKGLGKCFSALALGLADNTHLDFNGYHKNLIVS